MYLKHRNARSGMLELPRAVGERVNHSREVLKRTLIHTPPFLSGAPGEKNKRSLQRGRSVCLFP